MPTFPSAATAPPLSAADADWDEAFLRVESYLRAHGLESRVLLNRITAEIIREARERASAGSTGPAVAVAMDVTHARIGEWFARAGREVDWKDERMRARGRLALIIADLPGRWSNHFLSTDPVPPELAAAVVSFEFLPAPGLRLSAMPPAPLEFGFPESDDPSVPPGKLWIPARAVILWLAIAGFFGVAWAAIH